MKNTYLKVLLVVFAVTNLYIKETQSIKIDLKSNWTLINKEFNIIYSNVTIPNSVHSVLVANEYINDPLIGYNDVNFRWIVYADGWVFKNVFSVDSTVSLDTSTVNLILDSIDTFASIYVNDKLLLKASNQFVRYEITNVNKALVRGDNTIEIRFDSSVKRAQQLADQYPYR